VASVLLIDTTYGTRISPDEEALIIRAANYLESKHLTTDSKTIRRMVAEKNFRESNAYSVFFNRKGYGSTAYSYYAYTPVLSRTKIFIGESFWEVGTVGRSSVLLHELQHIRRHRRRVLRGFPRAPDEAEAYCRQYETHTTIGLPSYGIDGVVYWYMMIGIREYVLPLHPKYANEAEIRNAMRQLAWITWRLRDGRLIDPNIIHTGDGGGVVGQ